MSLKLVTGRSGCGKSRYILNDMSADFPALYIVPEQYSFSAEQKLIQSFGVVGLGGPQVLSFMRLADYVFSHYGSKQFISDTATYEMLVNYCANSILPDNLRLFDGLVRKNELTKIASTLLTTFKKYCVTPEKIQYAIDKTENVLLKKKLSDSLCIYKEYLNELHNAKIFDLNDKLSVMADILSDDSCDFLNGKFIYIDQFTDFDPSEYECIKVMLKKAAKVTVALCTDNSDTFETVNRTALRLQMLAHDTQTDIEPVEEFCDAMNLAKPMIKHLEQVYFEDETPVFAGTDGSISIFCGKDRYSEIRNVANKIVKLIRDQNFRYKDISVIARNAEDYKRIVEQIFPLYDIPIFIDSKIPLARHSITLFITSILEIALSGFTYENIFSFIKSPFSPLTKDESDFLENYCMAAGIRPYSWGMPFRKISGTYSCKNSKHDYYSDDDIEKINELREKVYVSLSEVVTKLRKKDTVSSMCGSLFEFFSELKLESKVKAYAEKLERQGENLYALQTVQVYNILINIFDDLCSVLGEKQLNIKEFYSVILTGLQAVEIGTIPSSSDCVTVGSIDRIKGHGAKVVFLVGANSGIFPAAPEDNGFFTDDDKKELAVLGIEMPPGLLYMTRNEQLLVYDALTCAGEKLFISYSASDNGQNVLLPSEIVERIRQLFPDISYEEDIITEVDDINAITAKKAVFDLLVSKIRAFKKDGVELSSALQGAAHYFINDKEYSTLLRYALQMTNYTNSTAVINSELLNKWLGEDIKTSISRLETYNKCPFSFFAKYILMLEPKKKFELKVSDSGSFLHDFLDRFSSLVTSSKDSDGNLLSWSKIDDDFIKTNTPAILKDILSGVNRDMLEIPRIKALFTRLCNTAVQSVYAIRRHIIKSDFIPLGYEISFDEEGNFKPIKIKLDDGKEITLRGRIDRADQLELKTDSGTGGKFVRIIDYKSTDKTLSLCDVYDGVQLQLFVYLSALCENGFSPAGILYCNLSDPIVEVSPRDSNDEIFDKKNTARRMSGIVLSENGMLEHMGGNEILKSKKSITAKNFNSMFRHLNNVIRQTVQNITKGKFPIECRKDACTYCDYSQLCLFDPTFSGCNTRESVSLKDEEIWALLEEEVSENEMD